MNKLVPVEPSEEMLEAGFKAFGGHEEGRPVWKLTVDRQAYYCYKAMIDSVPEVKLLDSEQIEVMVRQVCDTMYGDSTHIEYTYDDDLFYCKLARLIESHYGIA